MKPSSSSAWRLRGARSVIATSVLLAACTVGESTGPAPAVSAPPTVRPVKGLLTRIQGDVTVKRAEGDDWLTPNGTIALHENDKVRTARGATAAIELENGSLVQLGEDALVAIAETKPRPGQDRADLTVLRGRVDAKVDDAANESLSVATPSATIRAGREVVFQ